MSTTVNGHCYAGDPFGRGQEIDVLRPNTVFILGAAFSKELGLPLGEGLKEKILSALPRGDQGGGDETLRRLINLQGNPDWSSAAALLRKALPFSASIDNLVEHHQQDEIVVQVAKWAIATAIAKEEVNSELGQGSRTGPARLQDVNKLNPNGYHDLFRLIVAGARRNDLDLAFSRLKIVTFNYDRTLELFLRLAVSAHSNLNLKEADSIVSQATILHAYGVLDPEHHVHDFSSRFTAIHHPDQIPVLAAGLRTFSEKNSSGEDEPIRRLVGQAQRVIFLGCAFHRQNLELIRPNDLVADDVYATVYVPAPIDPAEHAKVDIATFSTPSVLALQAELASWRNPRKADARMMLEAMTCRQLVARHGVRWTE